MFRESGRGSLVSVSGNIYDLADMWSFKDKESGKKGSA